MADLREYKREKEDSRIGKIVIDRETCIGAAPCVAIAPEVFKLDEVNRAIVLDANAVDDETLMSAAQSCPTKAILLYDKEGNKIFPK